MGGRCRRGNIQSGPGSRWAGRLKEERWGEVLFVFSFPVIPARADGREAVKNPSRPEHGRHGANRFCFAKNH